MSSITIDSMNQYAPTGYSISESANRLSGATSYSVSGSANGTSATAPLANHAGQLRTIGGKVFTFLDGSWAKAYGLELYNARKAGTIKDFQWADTYRDITANQKTVQHPGFFATIKGGIKKLCGKESGLGPAKIITGKEAEIKAACKSAYKTAYKKTYEEALKAVPEGTAIEVAKTQAKALASRAGKTALKTARSSVGTATQETGKAAAKSGIFSKILGGLGKKLGPILIAGMTLFSMYQGYKEGGVVEALKEGIKGVASLVFYAGAIALATAVLGPLALPFALLIGIGGSMIGDKIMSAVLGKSIAEKKADAAAEQEKAPKQVASGDNNNISTGNIYGDLAKIDPNIMAKMARDNAYFNNPNPFMPQNLYPTTVPSAVAS